LDIYKQIEVAREGARGDRLNQITANNRLAPIADYEGKTAVGFLSCACVECAQPAVRVKERLVVTGTPCSLAYPTKSAVGTKSGEPSFVTFETSSLMECFVGPSFQNGSGPGMSTVAVAVTEPALFMNASAAIAGT